MSRFIGQLARKVENAFPAAARIVFHHPLKCLVAVLLIVGTCAASLPQLKSDGRIEAFMHADDPALLAYYDMRRWFGQDNRIVVTVETDDLFSRPFLEKLSRLHRDIENQVPYIAEIFSLYNIPFIQYKNGGIFLEELVRNMIARNQDPRAMRDRILDTPLYRNFIISEDGTTASIIVEPFRYAPADSDCMARPQDGVVCEDVAPAPTDRRSSAPGITRKWRRPSAL